VLIGRDSYAEVMRILPLIALPAVTLLALSGCAFAPRGPVVSESRDLDAATSVVLETSGDLTIREGEPSLVIHAPAEVLARLTSAVVDGELVLGTTPGTPGFLLSRISYELTLPGLDGIRINGAGDVDSDVPADGTLRLEINGAGDLEVAGIDTTEVALAIHGSGDVELHGVTDSLAITLDGTGDVAADDLDSADVTVEVNGVGDITVAASATLDVSISGAGSITYTGRPEVTQDIAGAGSVSRG